MKTLTTLLVILSMQSCAVVREKLWPVELAVFGGVRGHREYPAKRMSHQEQLSKTYSEAWCEGFGAGYRARKDEKEKQ